MAAKRKSSRVRNHKEAMTSVAAVFTGATLSLLLGCDRAESIKVVNDFSQPVRVEFHGIRDKMLIPAHGSAVLDTQTYMGGSGVYVTVFSEQGKVLREKELVQLPGDSAWRSAAVLEVKP